VAIDDGDAHRRAGKSPGGSQSSEPASDDHDVWRHVSGKIVSLDLVEAL
jgi:hypothetical protein